MTDEKDILIFSGFILNFLGVLFAIFNSRIKLERRIVVLETYIKILMHSTGKLGRRESDIIDFNFINERKTD